MGFKESLIVGKTGESKVAQWLISQGRSILPVYEIAENQYKGPALYCHSKNLVAPDMLVFGQNKITWIEVKTKTAFSWHRKTKRFVTGIDLKHYFDYLEIAKNTTVPLWIFFLHGKGTAVDTPEDKISPSGLFGRDILYLEKHENHRHDNWGNSGMVYWDVEDLELIASLEQIG